MTAEGTMTTKTKPDNVRKQVTGNKPCAYSYGLNGWCHEFNCAFPLGNLQTHCCLSFWPAGLKVPTLRIPAHTSYPPTGHTAVQQQKPVTVWQWLGSLSLSVSQQRHTSVNLQMYQHHSLPHQPQDTLTVTLPLLTCLMVIIARVSTLTSSMSLLLWC